VAKNISLHEDLTREEAVKGSSDRAFGSTFAVVALVVGGLSLWRGGGAWPYALAAAAAFGGLALAAPRALAPLNWLWLRFGLLLHRVVNPLIMGLMFFLVVAPTGLVMRLGGKDFLRLKFDRAARTYWIAREPPGPAPETMRHQF